MTRIILSGYAGAMGQVITRSVARRKDCVIVAGIDPATIPAEYPTFTKAEDCTVSGDVILDFSHPKGVEALFAFAEQHQLPLVEATTGLAPEQIQKLETLSETLPVLFSYNMSLGVNLMAELVKTAAKLLGQEFDIEIVEQHHNKKIDAPSGTALLLADAAASVMNPPPEYVYDRHTRRESRPNNEIGIHSVRGGTIVGEHEVIFAGHDEILTIRHTALSKDIFGVGAINGAVFLAKQPPGLYHMGDLID